MYKSDYCYFFSEDVVFANRIVLIYFNNICLWKKTMFLCIARGRKHQRHSFFSYWYFTVYVYAIVLNLMNRHFI